MNKGTQLRWGFLLAGVVVLAGICEGVDKSGLRPTVLSLPSGPGSIEGLGSTFEPQLNSGTASYGVPLQAPPGRAGFSPEISLAYDSGFGNGVFGVGWRVNLPFIARQSEGRQPFYSDYPSPDGVDNDQDGEMDEFDEYDTYFFEGREELAPAADGTWRCRTEGRFIRFERVGQGWVATRPDGVKLTFGITSASRVQDGAGRIYAWRIDKMEDTHQNRISFTWERMDAGAQVYCTAITYNEADAMRVEFDYESRPDLLTTWRPRYELRTTHRCSTIRMLATGELVREYRLAYAAVDHAQPLSLLSSVTQVGADGTSTLPPATFEYVPFDGQAAATVLLEGAPVVDLQDGNIDLIDLNGDALPDILDTTANPHGYYMNLGPLTNGQIEWSSFLLMSNSIQLHLGAETCALADMDGNSRTDLLNLFGSQIELFRIDENMEWNHASNISNATFSLHDPEVRLLDANGDRFIDVMMTAGGFHSVWICLDAKEWSSPYNEPAPAPSLRFSQVQTRQADMNGDRLVDLVHLANESCYYYLNAGYGSYTSRIDMAPAPTDVQDDRRLILSDVNGDGMSDIIHVSTTIRVWINLGLDPGNPAQARLAPPIAVNTPYVDATTHYRTGDLNGNGSMDLILNTVLDGSRRLVYVDLAPGEQPYQLKRIRNGIGRTTTIHYRTSVEDMAADRRTGTPWPSPAPLPVPVVESVEVDAGLPPSRESTFRYHDAYYDAEKEQFRGFGRAEQSDLGDASQPDLLFSFQYHTGRSNEALKGRVRVKEAGIGPITSVWTHYDGLDNDGDGNVDEADELDTNQLFYHEENSWETRIVAPGVTGDTRQILFPYVRTKTRDLYELGQGTPVRLQWEYQYDDFGNMTRLVEHGRTDPGWNDERVTVMTYSAAYPSGRDRWILDRLVERVVQYTNGTLVAKQQNFYDDETFSATGLGQISRGDLTMTLDWVDPESPTDFVQTLRQSYDAYGNPTAIHDALWEIEDGHWRQIVYDHEFQTFPIQEIIHTGHTNLPTLTLSAQYDTGWGEVTNSTDFNGFVTTYAYDTFGRVTSITKPPDTDTTVEYDYVLAHPYQPSTNPPPQQPATSNQQLLLNWVESRKREENNGGTVDSRSFFDGMGRKIMTRAEGEWPGQIVVTDTVKFNARQQPWKNYLPYFEQDSTLDFVDPSYNIGFMEHFYDSLGRGVRVNQPVDPNGSVCFSTSFYEPLVKTLHDEEQTKTNSLHYGCGMRYVEDGLQDEDGNGRLREVVEIVKLTDDGEPIDHAVEWKTTYQYDLLDNFIGYTDSQNNQKLIEYDGLSRKIFMNDPDRSWMWYAYDEGGNLIRTRDAKGQEIVYTYDGVNRLSAEYYTTGAERIGNALMPGERWVVSAASFPAREPDVAYHYDVPFGPVDCGKTWQTGPAHIIANAILWDEYDSDYDTNRDGKIDAADVVKAAAIGRQTNTLTASNTKGYLSWVRDLSGEEHNTYDSRGRVAWVIKKIDDGTGALQSFCTRMEYDSMDRLKRLIYPDQSYAYYTYNSRGLLESVGNLIRSYGYNPSGQNAELELACGVTTTWEYDHRLRLKRLRSVRQRDGLNLQDLNYTYDEVSNITAIEDERTTAELDQIGVELGIDSTEARKFNATQSFGYDSLYRLTEAANPTIYGTIDYRYDRIANMIQKDAGFLDPDSLMDLDLITSGGALGTSGRIGRVPGASPGPHALTQTHSTSNLPPSTDSYAYDSNGNMTHDGQSALWWDHKDRLIAISNAGHVAEYLYGYTDRRIVKTVNTINHQLSTTNPSFTLYIDKLSEIRDNQLIKYIYADDQRIARSDMPSMDLLPSTFYLNDHLGSSSLTLSTNASVLEQYVHYPYGHPRQLSQALPSLTPYTFTGKEHDAESALHYFEARYYASLLGRFNRVDPLCDHVPTDWLNTPQQLNLYVYALNNPLAYNDPNGKFANFIIGGLIGAGIEIFVQVAVEGKDIKNIDLGRVAISTMVGAATSGGAALTATKTVGQSLATRMVSQGAVSALGSASGSAAQQLYKKGNIDLNEVGTAARDGFIGGLLATGVGDLSKGFAEYKVVQRASRSLHEMGVDPLGKHGGEVVSRIENMFTKTTSLIGDATEQLVGATADIGMQVATQSEQGDRE